MFGNTNALDSAFEAERQVREQAEKRFSDIPNKNLVQIVKNYDTTPVYGASCRLLEKISSKIKYGKNYGTQEQLINNPEAYIPTERDKNVILEILYQRM